MNGKQLKNSILQWAIQGKLVPQDPNDEPASVLLEKIRQEKERLIKEKKIKRDKNASIIFRGEDNSYYEKFIATGMVKCIDEEIPFEIPQGWEWCRVGDLFLHNNGKQLNKGNSSGVLMEYITTSNLYWDGFRLYNLKMMPFENKEIERCQALKGDLLVCEGGDIGRSCIWEYDRPIMLQNHIHKLRAYIPLFTKYFYYIFYLYNLSGIIGGKGIGIQGFSSKALHNTIVPLPPLSEQQRIVAKIDELMPLVELYDKAQSELDKLNTNIRELLKKAILQYAIEGKLVPQCEEDGTAEDLLREIQAEKQRLYSKCKLKKKDLAHSTIFRGDDNKYYEQIGKNRIDITDKIPFEIPNNWVWTRLSDVADIYTGNSISETEKNAKYTNVVGRNYIGTKDVGFDNKVFYNNGVAIPKEYEQNFRIALKDSILMCIEGGSAGRKVAILNQDVCFGNKLCCLSPFIETGKYIYFYLQSPSFIDMFNQNKAGIIGGVSIAKVKDILFPLPPLKEQCRIIHRLEELYALL